MEKIKIFFSKTNRNLLHYSILLIVILIVTHFALKIFNLKFRQWVYLTISTVSIIGMFIHLIKEFIKKSKRFKLKIGFICATLVILCKIFWKEVGFIFFFLVCIVNPKKEYVVETHGCKYIASAESGFLNTTVYFYEYVDSFIMGSEEVSEKHYKGSYDPIARENENVGFINNLSLIILGNENDGLLVTVDGGKSFKNSNFIFPLDVQYSAFYINDLPYLEDDKLKVKLFVSGSTEDTYYEFTSVDNGLNWVCTG